MKNKKAQVFHFDLYGKREDKYDFLNENSLKSIAWAELDPQEPELFFVQKDYGAKSSYDEGFSVAELFLVNSVGIVTARDNFTIHDTKEEVEKTINTFLSLNDETARTTFKLGKDVRDWQVNYARTDLQTHYPSKGKFAKVSYRPFDEKWTFYTGKSKGFHCYPRADVMQHFLKGENVGLVTARQCVGNWQYVFCTKFINEFNLTGTAGRFGSGNTFPLYLYPDPTLGAETERVPNFNMEIVERIAEKLGLTFIAEKFPSTGGVAESRGGTLPSSEGVSEGRGGRNTQNYMSLPYNPKLKERARELRKAGNLSEVLFWNQVKNKQFKGLDFDRQKVIGNYIVDFYCANCNVVVEIDGSSHDNKQEYDAARDAFLESLGLTVIHIPVADVMNNMGAVMDMLLDHPAFIPPRPADTPPTEGDFTPIDVLDYIYAVLHSPSYREKYKEFLKIDFPRVPYPKDQESFWKLVELGGEIRQIHLLESPIVEKYITQYPVDGDNIVSKPRFENSPPPEGWLKAGVVGKVYINETQYFDNVPQVAWEFYIGGYQPAQKWLKDRKDRTLDFEDILHYQKIIVALTETDKLMKEIDEVEAF